MKILVSAYACDPTRGGEFNNGWNYAYNSNRDREIWCLTTIEGKVGIIERLKSEPQPYLKVIYVEVPDWMLRIKHKSPQIGVYLHYLYWHYCAYKVGQELDKDIDFDVVHHATYSSLQMGSFLWKLKKPMLFGPVGGGQRAPSSFKKYFYGGWKLERVRDFISFLMMNVFSMTKNTLRHSAITLVVNQDTYQLAKKHGAQQMIYSPCTLLPDDFAPKELPIREKSEKLRLLWIGRLLPRKGLRLILESIAIAKDEIDLELTIIGDGALAEQLPLWIKELEIIDKVKWLGRQPMSEVKKAYATHDIFIYCSIRESLAAQFFESMAHGLPMIIFDLHGARTFISSEVALKVPVSYPEETVKKIKEAIVKLGNDPAKREEMSVMAYQEAQKFTRNTRIQYINDYYQKVSQSSLTPD